MSLLATVRTDVGKVELHHEAGMFTTQRVVRGIEAELLTSRPSYVCTILVSRESALEWYELAKDGGAVIAAFPEEVAA